MKSCTVVASAVVAVFSTSVGVVSAATTTTHKNKITSTKKQSSFILNTDNGEDHSVSVPMTFHQKLLVCNSCSGWEGVRIFKNDQPTKNKDPLPFNECRYIDGKIYSQDRINFMFDKESVKGTFEIDELPQSDSVLLLIVQRRPEQTADLVSFQSFAFAPSESLGESGKTDAQVAFLNTVGGDSDTRVRMSDANGDKKVATREEQVLFNHVYAIEEGDYSMSLLSDSGMAKAISSRIRLNRGEDYVVLKTGTAENPQLIVFPNSPDSSIRLLNLLYVIAVLGPIIALGILLSLLRDNMEKKGTTPSSSTETMDEAEEPIIAAPSTEDV